MYFKISSRRSHLWLQESVQASQEQKTAAEDQSSRVTFEVEVLHFQAYLQAELAPGRFLLAAQKGRVEGRSMAHLMQNLTTLTLDQVRTACSSCLQPLQCVFLSTTLSGPTGCPLFGHFLNNLFYLEEQPNVPPS